MKLAELSPEFIRYERRGDGHVYMPHVESIVDAQGINFLCPHCYGIMRGMRGTHDVICWSRSAGTPDLAHPGPGRWKIAGTGFHDLTLNAELPGGARSVDLTSTCGAHFFVTNGEIH